MTASHEELVELQQKFAKPRGVAGRATTWRRRATVAHAERRVAVEFS